jgi:MFS family permease
MNVLVALALGVVLLVAFVAWEHHATQPMLPLEFFHRPRFSSSVVAISLTFFALFGFIFLLTQYLQFVRGLSPLAAGLRLAPPAIGIGIGAPLAPRIVERVGTKVVVGSGLFLACACMVTLSRTSVLQDDTALAITFALFGFGMGLTMAPVTEAIMGSVPKDGAGVGSAVNDTTRQTGGALGVAVLGSLLATRYNARIDALGLSHTANGVARQSIGAALKLAHQMPPLLATKLVHAAEAGFASGMQLAVLVGAGVVFVAAVVVVLFLPARTDTATGEEKRPAPAPESPSRSPVPVH